MVVPVTVAHLVCVYHGYGVVITFFRCYHVDLTFDLRWVVTRFTLLRCGCCHVTHALLFNIFAASGCSWLLRLFTLLRCCYVAFTVVSGGCWIVVVGYCWTLRTLTLLPVVTTTFTHGYVYLRFSCGYHTGLHTYVATRLRFTRCRLVAQILIWITFVVAAFVPTFTAVHATFFLHTVTHGCVRLRLLRITVTLRLRLFPLRLITLHLLIRYIHCYVALVTFAGYARRYAFTHLRVTVVRFTVVAFTPLRYVGYVRSFGYLVIYTTRSLHALLVADPTVAVGATLRLCRTVGLVAPFTRLRCVHLLPFGWFPVAVALRLPRLRCYTVAFRLRVAGSALVVGSFTVTDTTFTVTLRYYWLLRIYALLRLLVDLPRVYYVTLRLRLLIVCYTFVTLPLRWVALCRYVYVCLVTVTLRYAFYCLRSRIAFTFTFTLLRYTFVTVTVPAFVSLFCYVWTRYRLR